MIASSHFAFEWLFDHARRAPHAMCVGTPSGWLTYSEVADRVRRLASHLSAHGLRQSDFSMIALPNGPAAVVASLAVQSLGGCAVEVSANWGAEALRSIAEQTGARQAIIQARHAPIWNEAGVRFEHVCVTQPSPASSSHRQWAEWPSLSSMTEDGVVADAPDGSAPREFDAEVPALLMYTSGSTGSRRGVIQTHRNVSANTRSICAYLELTAADRVMSILPLYHCYGKSLLQTHLFAGGSVFFDHRFLYPRVVMSAISEQGCTGFAGVPATFELLREHVSTGRIDKPTLRYLTQAGGAMQQDTIRWVRAAFAPAKLFVMYGQTEATGRLSYLPPEMAEIKAGSIGRGVPGVQLAVLDENLEECAAGAVGALVARGENVTPGYFGDAGATAEILHDGWLWTGDLAYRDADGFVYIIGRVKDMLKLRGHRVGADEIEQLLRRHPAVGEAAVVGAPDALEGERAVAFVVTRDGMPVSEEDLKRFCRDRAAGYMIPRRVLFETSLPRTDTGKLAKGLLKTRALQA